MRGSVVVVAVLLLGSVAICIQAACPCDRPGVLVLNSVEATDPRVSTDKPDYSPGETVGISGSGFCPGTQLRVRVTRPDGSVVTGDGSFELWPTAYDNVIVDSNGELAYSYVLDGIEGEYLVEVLDPDGLALATCTFTDGGAITQVTLMYPGQVGTHVTVPPGASITAIVTVHTYSEETDASNDWEGTRWLIANSWVLPGGAVYYGTCVDHQNHDGAGTYTETLTMTAPLLAGTYDARFTVCHSDYLHQPPVYIPCSLAFDWLILEDAVEVECTPPAIASPADITQGCDPGACGAVVTWTTPVATGNPPPTVECSPSSGSLFPVGETTVTCTAANACGTDTAYFAVVVTDEEPPQITCPGDITQENDPGVCQAAVAIPLPTATDNCGVASTVNSHTGTADASGVYPVGTTAVLWTAADIHGNSSSCTMDITVADAEGPTVELVAIPQNPSSKTEPYFDWQGTDANDCTPSEDLQFSTNLDGSGWSSWSSSLSQTCGTLSEGEHTFEVRGRDQAGNVGTTVSYTWRIDLTPPVIRVDVPFEQAVYFHGSEILADWSVSDNEPGTSLSVDATCASGVAIDTTTPGTRLYFVEVSDSAGNVERIDVSYRIAYVVRGAQPWGDSAVGEHEETPCFLDKCMTSPVTSSEQASVAAVYQLGETIGIAAVVTDANDDPIADALCAMTIVQVSHPGEDEQYNIVGCFMLPYVPDIGIYLIDIATLGENRQLEVGYYDLWIDLDDETHIQRRIEIIEPSS